MEIKVGQKVVIKESLESGQEYDGLFFNPSMKKYRGQTLTVKLIDPYEEGDKNKFMCKGIEDWVFNPSMVTSASKGNFFNVGDTQAVFFNDKKGVTVLVDYHTNKRKKVTCAKEDTYSRRIGFLEAYFQMHSGLKKEDAHKFLDNFEE